MLKSNKFWAIALGVILLVSAAIAFIPRRSIGDVANIYRDGVLIKSVDLSAVKEPYSFTLQNGGDVNVISVEHGRIRISDANCPDKLCVRQGWISDSAAPIVCLPHRLVITISSAVTPYYDAIAS